MIRKLTLLFLCAFICSGYTFQKIEPSDILSASQQHLKDNFTALIAGTGDTAGTGLDTWQVGDGGDTNKDFVAGNDDSTKPFIRYIATQDTWAISNSNGGINYFVLATSDTGSTNNPNDANGIWAERNKLCFEGATADGFETCITLTEPTADRTFTLGNVSQGLGLRVKTGAYVSDGTTGNEVITGVGFQPLGLVLFSGVSSGTTFQTMVAFSDGSSHGSTALAGAETPALEGNFSDAGVFIKNAAASAIYSASTITFNTDGFTVNDSADSTTTDFYYFAIA